MSDIKGLCRRNAPKTSIFIFQKDGTVMDTPTKWPVIQDAAHDWCGEGIDVNKCHPDGQSIPAKNCFICRFFNELKEGE